MKQPIDLKPTDILTHEGLGELRLGMPFTKIKLWLEAGLSDRQSFDRLPWHFYPKPEHPGFIDIVYQQYLIITVSVSTGDITHLRVRKGYLGKAGHLVGIGDSVTPYFEQHRQDYVGFEQGSFCFQSGQASNISFYIGKQYTRGPSQQNWQRYLSRPIRQIEICDKVWLNRDQYNEDPSERGNHIIHLHGVQLKAITKATQ